MWHAESSLHQSEELLRNRDVLATALLDDDAKGHRHGTRDVVHTAQILLQRKDDGVCHVLIVHELKEGVEAKGRENALAAQE